MRLGELGGGGHHGTGAVDDEGATVEDELVLAPHLVHVGDGAPGLGHPLAGHGQTVGSAADGIRRGVHVDDEARPAGRLGGDGAAGEPQVLAHRHAHGHAGHLVQLEVRGPRCEPPLLVEDAVVGQPALVVHAEHVPAGAHGQGVAQPSRRAPDGGLAGHHAGPVGPGHGVGDAVVADDVDEPHQGHAAGVAEATRCRAARLSATNAGFRRRSSGG